MSFIRVGDCREVLKSLPDCSVDSVVTDPPYELGFMGKAWDASGIAYDQSVWSECWRVLKPGGHLLAFSGSRTYHRMACAIEDAGFEIRDQIMWVYGSGFPKSLNVSIAIDKTAGAISHRGKRFENARLRRQGVDVPNPTGIDAHKPATDDAARWEGWGTALKPAHEPIVLARKPLIGTVAANVLAHGTGALNIDGCRVETTAEDFKKLSAGVDSIRARGGTMNNSWKNSSDLSGANPANAAGRWPANFIHDGSDEVLDLFPEAKGGAYPAKRGQAVSTAFAGGQDTPGGARAMGDTGSAARFFYCAKASKTDRNEGLDQNVNHHPTVKPTTLMRYLCRLITPPGGVVLDPFAGSGSTGKAAVLEGFGFIGIEQDEDYAAIAEARIAAVVKDEELF